MTQPGRGWPQGYASAACITFDFDAQEVWLAADPANAQRPGVLSHGTYGARVGLPLILELLRDLGLHTTFFVPRRVAQRHGDEVAQIVQDGHELALHGHSHRSPSAMPPAEEEEQLVRAVQALRTHTEPILGCHSPSWELSPHTLGILGRHGLLIELPVHWSLDDAPYFWFSARDWTRRIAPPAEVREIWQAERSASPPSPDPHQARLNATRYPVPTSTYPAPACG